MTFTGFILLLKKITNFCNFVRLICKSLLVVDTMDNNNKQHLLCNEEKDTGHSIVSQFI